MLLPTSTGLPVHRPIVLPRERSLSAATLAEFKANAQKHPLRPPFRAKSATKRGPQAARLEKPPLANSRENDRGCHPDPRQIAKGYSRARGGKVKSKANPSVGRVHRSCCRARKIAKRAPPRSVGRVVAALRFGDPARPKTTCRSRSAPLRFGRPPSRCALPPRARVWPFFTDSRRRGGGQTFVPLRSIRARGIARVPRLPPRSARR